MNIKNLVAHRGDNTNYPENSLIGVKAALEIGAVFVELDVQMNADYSLLVIHDSTFKRTAGLDLSVLKSTNKQISDISVHESQRFADQHNPCPVSTLDAMMELLEDFPKAIAFVEIKEESLDHFGIKTVMDKLLVELHPYFTQSVIISFSYQAIEYAKIHSQLKTGWVISKYNEKNHHRALQLEPDYLFCDHKIIPKKNLWPGHWKWAIYTLNETGVAHHWLNRGINLVETDDIQRLAKELQHFR